MLAEEKWKNEREKEFFKSNYVIKSPLYKLKNECKEKRNPSI